MEQLKKIFSFLLSLVFITSKSKESQKQFIIALWISVFAWTSLLLLSDYEMAISNKRSVDEMCDRYQNKLRITMKSYARMIDALSKIERSSISDFYGDIDGMDYAIVVDKEGKVVKYTPPLTWFNGYKVRVPVFDDKVFVQTGISILDKSAIGTPDVFVWSHLIDTTDFLCVALDPLRFGKEASDKNIKVQMKVNAKDTPIFECSYGKIYNKDGFYLEYSKNTENIDGLQLTLSGGFSFVSIGWSTVVWFISLIIFVFNVLQISFSKKQSERTTEK